MVTIQDVAKNCETLTGYLHRGNETERDFAKGLVAKGATFLPFLVQSDLYFFPSRFIGRPENNLEKHSQDRGSGTVTNSALQRILGEPVYDEDINELYLDFCRSIGVERPSPAYGIGRRFWPVLDAGSLSTALDQPDGAGNTERITTTFARLGQQIFRRRLLDEYNACFVTGCRSVEVLKASHIKPWAESHDSERLDKNNGLLLTPNLDWT